MNNNKEREKFMNKTNDTIDNVFFWFVMIIGNIMIYGILAFMIYTAWSIGKVMIIIPLLIIVAIRRLLWGWFIGTVTFDSSKFPIIR